MTDIQVKYARLRPQITNGCIINVRGHSLLTRIIEWTCGYYSHSLLAFVVGERLFAIQSVAQGVAPAFLSTEIFANDDFVILKPKFPQAQLDDAVNKYFAIAERGIPYNFFELPKLLLKLKLGIYIGNMQGNKADSICSVSAGYNFGGLLPIKCFVDYYNANNYLTPQNLSDLAKANPSEMDVIGDDSGS